MHEFTAVPSDAGDTKPAIAIRDVSKIYRLYDSVTDQALDALGIAPLLFWRGRRGREFQALKNISLNIAKGERVGIVGRNGAGKSTLLRLLTGNFMPTSGTIGVEGSVQALMHVGLGFHPEFTGYENIRSSLLYNGLGPKEYQTALENIIDFVELGEFLHQPVKTYSLGMKSRLQFATATAIKPDILIIDEVLGAGDAYFSAKSADRMKKLTSSGCTLLLVSHSTPQVLAFCNRAIWLEKGEVVMDDNSWSVVKRYEEYNQRLSSRWSPNEKNGDSANNVDIQKKKCVESTLLSDVLSGKLGKPDTIDGAVADTGASRWQSEIKGITISSVNFINKNGQSSRSFETGDEMTVEICVVASESGEFPCCFSIMMFNEGGVWVTRNISDRVILKLSKYEKTIVRLYYKTLLLGRGKYIVSIGAHERFDIFHPEDARFYDLLSRSFSFNVTNLVPGEESLFFLDSNWKFNECSVEKKETSDMISHGDQIDENL